MLAGEVSGDEHGADVALSLRRRLPGVRLIGTGGPRMASAGVELVAGLEDLAVMGFFEVIRRIGFFRRLERRVQKLISDGAVDLVLPVDYPGFNMRISSFARRMRVPVLFYIAPQVWAWKARRASQLARDVDRLAVILPFEVPIFERAGADVTFVGHPLLDHQVEQQNGDLRSIRDPSAKVLAVLPGSRQQEIHHHLEMMLAAAALVRAKQPDLQVVVARARGLEPFALPDGVQEVRDGRTLLRRAHVAIVKSGTSTLEAALAGVPFVVVYRTNWVTWQIARRLVQVDSVALANLVAGRRVVPELLQHDATSKSIASEILSLLEEPRRTEMMTDLATVRERLGSPGAADRVADIAMELLGVGSDSRSPGAT